MHNRIKILVPTDFSEIAENATHFAAELSRKFESEIILLHVCQLPLAVSDVPYEVIENDVKIVREASGRNMDLALKKLHKLHPEGKVRHLMMEGTAVDNIISEINKEKIDLVIIGAHNKSKFENLFFGSVVSGVIEKSKVPVLVVPEKVSFKPFENIVYATSYLDKDIAVLKNLSVIIKAFHSSVCILHVENDGEQGPQLWKDEFEKDVKTAVGIPNITFETIPDNSLAHGLDTFTRNERADLLVMVTRKRGAFEKLYDRSFTEKYSYHTSLPLMVFHDGEE